MHDVQRRASIVLATGPGINVLQADTPTDNVYQIFSSYFTVNNNGATTPTPTMLNKKTRQLVTTPPSFPAADNGLPWGPATTSSSRTPSKSSEETPSYRRLQLREVAPRTLRWSRSGQPRAAATTTASLSSSTCTPPSAAADALTIRTPRSEQLSVLLHFHEPGQHPGLLNGTGGSSPRTNNERSTGDRKFGERRRRTTTIRGSHPHCP